MKNKTEVQIAKDHQIEKLVREEVLKNYPESEQQLIEEELFYRKSKEFRMLQEDKLIDEINNYIEHQISEKQKLEVQIFEWRENLKQQLFAELSFHQPETITDKMIWEEVGEELKEFDTHFKIERKRYGEL